MTDHTQQQGLAEVLARHQYDRERAVCSCSDFVQVGLKCDKQTHPEHVAEVLADAAVEAALAAKLTYSNQRSMDNAKKQMRAILDAAAPYMQVPRG